MKPSMFTTRMKTSSDRAVREPAGDRLRRQALLGDLRLRDLVDQLAQRLAPVGPSTGGRQRMKTMPITIESDRAEQQVGDGLVDRHVERADVDRDPLVQLHSCAGSNSSSSPVVLRRERDRGSSSQRRSDRAARALHAGSAAEVGRQPDAELERVRERVEQSGRERRARCRSTVASDEHEASPRLRERSSRGPARVRARGYPSPDGAASVAGRQRLRADPEHGARAPSRRAGSRRAGRPAARGR